LNITPSTTYMILLVAQALHLLHHRMSKRHISFAEVVSAVILCIPINSFIPNWLLMSMHILMVVIQIIGSLWIKRLSPDWKM
jgi:hypothetical protein